MHKLSKQKGITLLAISLGLVAGWVLFFIFKNHQAAQLELSNFILPQTVSYFEVNLEHPEYKELFDEQPVYKRDLQAILKQQKIPLDIWQASYKIKRLAKMKVKFKDNQYATAWLFYSPANIYSLEALGLKDYYTVFLNRHIMAISKNQALADEMRLKKNYIKINPPATYAKSMWWGYLDVINYYSGLKQLLNNEQQNLLDKYLNQVRSLNWRATYGEEHKDLIIDFQLSFKSGLIQKVVKDKQASLASAKKEKSFLVLEPSVVIKNFNSQLFLYVLSDYLYSELGDQANSLPQFLLKRYKVNINNLYTLFKQPMTIVIRPKDNKLNLKNILTEANYSYALIWQDKIQDKDSQLFIASLRQAVKNYLAFKFPFKRKKYLPDKTSGFELVADPQRFHWQQKLINGQMINFLEFKDGELAYTQTQNEIILANSKKLLIDILQTNQRTKTVDDFYNFYISPATLVDENLVGWKAIYIGGDFQNKILRGKVKLVP